MGQVPDETGGHRPGQGGSDHHVPQRAQNSKRNVLVECRQSEKREFHLFFFDLRQNFIPLWFSLV